MRAPSSSVVRHSQGMPSGPARYACSVAPAATRSGRGITNRICPMKWSPLGGSLVEAVRCGNGREGGGDRETRSGVVVGEGELGVRMLAMEALLKTSLPGLPVRHGKVRDVYDLGDKLLLVATDRISAFDWVMASGIPDKGRILTQLSKFWFDRLQVPNHLISTDIDTIDLPPG